MRLKIDRVMLMDSIGFMKFTTCSGLDSGYNFHEIKTGMMMEMMRLSRSREVGSVQQSFWGGVN